MNIETEVHCPECGTKCTMYLKKRSRTLRVECDKCGIQDHIPEYAERVVLE